MMASPNELWLTDFGAPYPGEPANFRPALVVGPADIFGGSLPFVLVVPTTTTRRGISLHVEIEPAADNGLECVSYAQCELVRSVNQRRLVSKLGTVDSVTAHAVQKVLRALFGY